MLNHQTGRLVRSCVGVTVLTLLVACGSGSGGSGGSSGSGGSALYIASSNPMSGDSGYYGVDKVKAINLALSDVNASGGVNGHPVKLVVDDDAGQPAQGASLAAKECTDSHVLAVIGHWNSSVSLAAAPIYGRCSLPNINDDTTVKLSGISPFEFRVFATGAVEGKTLAQYAYAKGYRRTAVVYDTNDYGITLHDAFASAFQALGGEVVLNDAYVEGNKNFAPDADKVKAANADSTFIAGYYLETALIAKAIRQGGITAPLLGGDGIDAPQLVQLGGSAVNGVVFADDYSPQLRTAANQQFVAKWSAKYGGAPDTFAALAYDATNLLVSVLKSGPTTRKGVQQSLEKEAGFVGVTGPIKFDSQHDAARPVYLLTVKDGNITLNGQQLDKGSLVSTSKVIG